MSLTPLSHQLRYAGDKNILKKSNCLIVLLQMVKAQHARGLLSATKDKNLVPSGNLQPAVVLPDKVRIAMSKRKTSMLSVVAQQQGFRHAIDVAETKSLKFNWNAPPGAAAMGPDLKGDDGWKPGPRPGPHPASSEKFSGPAPKVTNDALNSDTTAFEFVQTQITTGDKMFF